LSETPQAGPGRPLAARCVAGASLGAALGWFSWTRFGEGTGLTMWAYVGIGAVGCGIAAAFKRGSLWK